MGECKGGPGGACRGASGAVSGKPSESPGVHIGVPVEQHQENRQNHLAAQTQTRNIEASPAESHMKCLQPCIYIGPCLLEGFCFFVNTTSSWLLFVHQRSFLWTIPVDSGSNDFMLDSHRYVSDTDFYIQTTYSEQQNRSHVWKFWIVHLI